MKLVNYLICILKNYGVINFCLSLVLVNLFKISFRIFSVLFC